MRAILTVFAKEFRENLRERRTLLSALILGPVLGPLLFAGGLALRLERGIGENDRPLELAVSHGERAPNLLAYLRAHGVVITPVDYDEVAARLAVRAGRKQQVLAVDVDFARRLAAGLPAPLELYADASDLAGSGDSARVRALIIQYSALLGRMRLAARGIDPLLVTAIAMQDIDVSTPTTRSVLILGTLSYLVLLTMLMGGMYLAIDATAGERERGSLEPLLTLPVPREQLIYGKILAACAYMLLSLTLTVTAFAIVLRFMGLERFGMSVNFGPHVALQVILLTLPLVPLGAALMTLVAAYTRSYREAQTYLALMLLVPTLPLAFAGLMGLRPHLALMAIPSLSQHFLITSLLRAESLPAGWVALSVGVTLAVAVLLIAAAGGLYRREALLG
ncbi:MAG TPA: ABC transporter permease subunit [Steroidobacteraceae bacterium]|jgi:sodium transport system permease protein|nr:ABC transporter permease subunit [Steroidobacteraceae bacterium]